MVVVGGLVGEIVGEAVWGELGAVSCFPDADAGVRGAELQDERVADSPTIAPTARRGRARRKRVTTKN